MLACTIISLCLSSRLACAQQGRETSPAGQAAPPAPGSPASATPAEKPEQQQPEPKSPQAQAVNPEVQSEVGKQVEEKRAQLIKEAQSAVEETRKALDALTQGKKDEALASLERATGQLNIIVARDPKLAFAPVRVATIVRDFYASPAVAKAAVNQARDFLKDGRVQQARTVVERLASEVEIQVLRIPLATYPEAIKAIVPLIDTGKIEEAKNALQTALNTLVIDRYVLPLSTLRARAMLNEAEKLADKSNRTAEENKKLHDFIEEARRELQLGEVLGYGTKEDYKPLYTELDEIQRKTGGGKSGKGFFDRIKEGLRSLKDRIF